MRIGKFRIQRFVLVEQLDIVREFMQEVGFVPTRVELLFHSDSFEMIGFSEQFDDIKDGEKAPMYDAQIITHPIHENVYKFVRCSNDNTEKDKYSLDAKDRYYTEYAATHSQRQPLTDEELKEKFKERLK